MADKLSPKQERFLSDFMGLDLRRDAGGNVTGSTERPRDWGKFAKDALTHSWILGAPAAVAALPGVAPAAAGGVGTSAATSAAGGGIGGFVKKNWKDIATIGLGAAGAISNADKQGDANELQKRALEFAERDYNSRLPLREAFTQGSMRPIANAPNLSGIFADPSNPFYRDMGPLPHVPSQIAQPQPAQPAGAALDKLKLGRAS